MYCFICLLGESASVCLLDVCYTKLASYFLYLATQVSRLSIYTLNSACAILYYTVGTHTHMAFAHALYNNLAGAEGSAL